MAQSPPECDLSAAHGVLFVLLMACGSLFPALRACPGLWLAPFIAYFTIVAYGPRLRRSLHWFRAGKPSAGAIAATLGVMILTILELLWYQGAMHPDVRGLRSALPVEALGGIVLAGAVFTTANATLEELVFRGVLFDALQSRLGASITLIVTASLFGLGHLHGYPPSPGGACLAALFGLALGTLRLWTGGLALPIAAHMAADAAIYSILVRSEVP